MALGVADEAWGSLAHFLRERSDVLWIGESGKVGLEAAPDALQDFPVALTGLGHVAQGGLKLVDAVESRLGTSRGQRRLAGAIGRRRRRLLETGTEAGDLGINQASFVACESAPLAKVVGSMGNELKMLKGSAAVGRGDGAVLRQRRKLSKGANQMVPDL